jgi:hypothetical protein
MFRIVGLPVQSFDCRSLVGLEICEQLEQCVEFVNLLTEHMLDIPVFSVELHLDIGEFSVGQVCDPSERSYLTVPFVVTEVGVSVAKLELTVRRSVGNAVPIDRTTLFSDDATALLGVEFPKRLFIEQFDNFTDVALSVSLARENDEIDLVEEIRREPLFDRAVDQRFDIGRVCRAQNPVACVK